MRISRSKVEGDSDAARSERPQWVESGHSVRHIRDMTTAPDGKPTFRLAIGRSLHISGWPAILLAPLAVPAILLIVLAERLFGLKASEDLTARDVEDYLRDFLEGTGADWDWDDFTS